MAGPAKRADPIRRLASRPGPLPLRQARSPAARFTPSSSNESLVRRYQGARVRGAVRRRRRHRQSERQTQKQAIHLGSGQLAQAVRRFEAAVRADPGYLHARLQLAHALRRVGRPESALVEYEGALLLDPRMAEARLGYVVSLADLARWGAARAWLQEGRRTHPDRPEFVELLVRLLGAAPDVNVRDGRQALALGRTLVEQSRSWRTLEALAMALAESGLFSEAVARQQEAIDAYQRSTGRTNAAMTATLRRYERREPCRVPWVGDPIG